MTVSGNRSLPFCVQAQQDHEEGNTNGRARSVQKGILDVLIPEECAEGDRHENAVDKVTAIVCREVPSASN